MDAREVPVGLGQVLLRSGCAKAAAFSAERQSRRAPAARPAEQLRARAKPFAHQCNNRRRAAGGAPGLPHWGQPLSNHHGQRRV